MEDEIDESGRDYYCICPLNYNGTFCEVYTGEGLGMAQTFVVIFTIFFTILVDEINFIIILYNLELVT